MNDYAYMAVLALLSTSLLVRILPAFINIRINSSAKVWVEHIIPSAVFLNFIVYIVIQEVNVAPVPAIVSLFAVGLCAYFRISGLILTVVLGSVIYYFLVDFFGDIA
ncbi:hypothetical protein [Litoribacillus peritrichatus]|uniref:AzlD domain-containing protein n=1 Tax=Litoribacillus peritrichatus TaxID=718191 RepID=A0ABP7N6X4_9GAMM